MFDIWFFLVYTIISNMFAIIYYNQNGFLQFLSVFTTYLYCFYFFMHQSNLLSSNKLYCQLTFFHRSPQSSKSHNFLCGYFLFTFDLYCISFNYYNCVLQLSVMYYLWKWLVHRIFFGYSPAQLEQIMENFSFWKINGMFQFNLWQAYIAQDPNERQNKKRVYQKFMKLATI